MVYVSISCYAWSAAASATFLFQALKDDIEIHASKCECIFLSCDTVQNRPKDTQMPLCVTQNIAIGQESWCQTVTED